MFGKHLFAVFAAVTLVTSQFNMAMAGREEECCECGEGSAVLVGAATVGAVLLAPWALPLLGFTAGGIGAGTVAAKAMSLSWSSGVGSSVISTLQSAATYTGAKKAAGYAGKAAYAAAKNGCCSCD